MDVKYELLREIVDVRADVLNAVKAGIAGADAQWAQQRAKEAGDYDRFYAQLGLFGAAVAIVGTVVAATPPGLAVGAGVVAVDRIALMVGRVKFLTNANAAATVGGGVQAVGGGVGMWATYCGGLGKPDFVVKKSDLDKLSERANEHLDILLGKAKAHWAEFQGVRQALVDRYSKDPDYKDGFNFTDEDGKAHDIRLQLILDKLYRNLGTYDNGPDAFKRGIAMMVQGKVADLYDTVANNFLPEFKKNQPAKEIHGKKRVFMRSGVSAEVDGMVPNPACQAYFTSGNFLKTFVASKDYKDWKMRARVSQLPGMDAF